VASIEGAVLIPLGEVSVRSAEIPRDVPVYVHCKLGGRSATAVATLRNLGFTNVTNVNGGIAAWSESVDAGVPRY